jgi:hypothetical protein
MKDQANNIYIDVPMDSTVGFKIELKFEKMSVSVKGYLLYRNGRPVCFPELYRELIMRKFRESV